MKRFTLLFLLSAAVLLMLSSCGAENSENSVKDSNPPEGTLMVTEDQANPFTGSWQGDLDTGQGKLKIVFHVSYAEGQLTVTMDSPDQGVMGIKGGSAVIKGEEITLSLPAAGMEYTANVSDGTLTGTFKQAGLELPLTLQKTNKTATVNRPQEPKPPFPYISEDITFQNQEAGITLAGTFTIPKGDGPFPAVILITGSGPQNRDEAIAGHKPFLLIADTLTKAGIAVLRYDDRGIGESGGTFNGALASDFATDARGALKWVSKQEKIASVGILGHSEGAGVGAAVAADSDYPAASFLILIGGTGMSGLDVMPLQSKAIIIASGGTEAQAEMTANLNSRLYEMALENPVPKTRMETLLKGAGLTEENVQAQIATLTSPWYRDFLKRNPAEYLKKVSCPVLGIWGSKDTQVPADANLEAVRKALKDGKNPPAKLVKVEGANHLLQQANTGAPAEYASIEQTMDPVVPNMIADWILSLE